MRMSLKVSYWCKSIRKFYKCALPFTARTLSVIRGTRSVRAMQDFFLIILRADRLWWPNALARLFEFRAGFLVPSRAWGSYLFSPFHRSTDYFLGTIDRVRKERTYNRDSPINDESAAIEIYRRIPYSSLILDSIKSYSPRYWKIIVESHRSEKGLLIIHIFGKFKRALSLAPRLC